jgi:hypothetical protein
MAAVSVFWLQLKQRILLRQVPHAVLSWRYLLPRQPGYVRAHQYVFLNAWQGLPRVGWIAIALYSYLLWFLYQSWRQIWRSWHKCSAACARQVKVSRFKQLGHLMYLAFLQTTPPAFYYRYQLYRLPKEQWLKYVYTHELPHWHLAFSPAISEQSATLMSDKHAFAQSMGEQGLPVVDDVVIDARGPLQESIVFQRRGLFFKPVRGSQKQGCVGLHYDDGLDQYRLDLESGPVTQASDILKRLKDLIGATPYLVQPMLANHPQLLAAVPCQHLITFRVVTVMRDDTCKVISAILEWPLQAHDKVIYPIVLDMATGALLDEPLPVFQQEQAARERPVLRQTSLPIFKEMAQIVQAAHASFPDIFTIGWDLVWTPTGLKLLEGNINWGVDSHQLHRPVLIEHYVNKISGGTAS